MYNEDYSNGDGGIDWNNKYSYPLQWIRESEFARREYQCNLFRVKKAVLGFPSRNLYQEELDSNLSKIKDQVKSEQYKKYCLKVPEGKSYSIQRSVNTIANQMAGGVDAYEYQTNDKYGIIEPDTEDLLAATCKQDYILNKLERRAESFSRDLSEAGICAALVKYCPETDKNIVLRINPKNIWFDTRYSATGEERFRGYSTMISWAKVKKMIEQDGDEVNLDIKASNKSLLTEGVTVKHAKYSNRKIRSLNGLDIYVQDLNKLAGSSQLQNWSGVLYEDYMHDLRTCYNLGWYQTLATNEKSRTNSGYTGDDVELTVIYDLVHNLEFKILNRRYVISVNSEAFKRKLVFTITDPRTGMPHHRIDDFYLECPLKFVWEQVDSRDLFAFPVSRLMNVLDIHDELCAWRAKRNHVSQILSILRIQTNAADADSLRGILNVMGIVLDDTQGDINSLQFAYDYTAIDSEIEYRESLIKKLLNAYDEFDALQAMGDRASAAESGMALGAVAQGLATHQNAIMQMYAEIARQCITNRVAYSARQEFPIVNNGEYSMVTIQQMALTATINVKPKLAKRVEEKMASTNAMGILNGRVGQWLNNAGVAELISISLFGTLPRKMIQAFINEPQAPAEEIALAQQQAQNQAQMLEQNQQAYMNNPAPYEIQNTMDNLSSEEIEGVINGLAQGQGVDRLSELDEMSDTFEEKEEIPTTGISSNPEVGGELANLPM